MSGENMKPQEQLTLEPYERDHAVVVGVYRSVVVSYSHPCSGFDLYCITWCTPSPKNTQVHKLFHSTVQKCRDRAALDSLSIELSFRL